MEDRNKQQTNKQTKAQQVVGLVCLFVCLLAACVFGVLILYHYADGFFADNRIVLLVAVLTFTALLLVLGCIFCAKNYIALFRTVVTAAFLLAFFAAIYCLMLKTGFLTIIRDPIQYEEFLHSAGAWMAAVYILLQYLQVVILPIPSFVSTLAGVALFGPHLATLYSFIGIVFGSFTAFYIGRKWGSRAVAWIIGEDELNKWQEKLKGKDNFILTAMFLLPLFPDDVLCFVAGLSSMSNKYFSWMIIICRLIGVATTCYFVKIIPFNTVWGLICWGIIYATVIVVFILFYKNIDKINAWLRAKKK